ncbi:uncharacterized protein J3D65DRAFT_365159 [Phyllosticta citribraziliensis]|uniref:Uncharacterized protein n=1 Tax=Phyllosticta citribraziliensis TaxID=989973 RepID=A0ABR1LTI7_9PEZI
MATGLLQSHPTRPINPLQVFPFFFSFLFFSFLSFRILHAYPPQYTSSSLYPWKTRLSLEVDQTTTQRAIFLHF